MSLPGEKQDNVGIFWDYENVPLRQKDSGPFLRGLKSYIKQTKVAFARVYCRQLTMPPKREKEIRGIKPFDVKFTTLRGEDAVDMSLIQSCLQVLDDQPEIDHVLILTGDIDYAELVTQLKNWKVRVTLICQEGNHSPYLADATHRAYSVAFVAEFPQTWWKQAPRAEITAILDTRYTSDPSAIAGLMQQLDPAFPYHSAAILEVLETRFELTADDLAEFEKFKALITPALQRFEARVVESRDQQAIARVGLVWDKVRAMEIHHYLLLGVNKTPGAFEKLLPLLDHADKSYRQAAIQSLGHLGDPRARFPLEHLKAEILKKIDPRLEHPLIATDEQTLEYIDKTLPQLTK